MSAIALQGLLDYLLDTLSVSNRRWLAAHLIEPESKAEPYSQAELIARAEESVREIESGAYSTEEQMEKFMDEALCAMTEKQSV